MQVKKFEAPTIQEALDTIKRELGPDAIILQTKKHKKGFGLMSSPSVEVTAAVSEKKMASKRELEKRLPKDKVKRLQSLPTDRQAKVYDEYMSRQLGQMSQETQDRVSLTSSPVKSQSPAGRRYVDIEDEPQSSETSPVRKGLQSVFQLPSRSDQAPKVMIQQDQIAKELRTEIGDLKQALNELKLQKQAEPLVKMADAPIRSKIFDSPTMESIFERLVVAGIDRSLALNLIKRASFERPLPPNLDEDQVIDWIAMELFNDIAVDDIAWPAPGDGSAKVVSLVGPTGVGKTTTVAKLASEAVLKRGLKVALINIDTYKVAAKDQLSTYAKILNIPFRSVDHAAALKTTLEEFQGHDLVLIDTTGRSQKDVESLQAMKSLMELIPQRQTVLVMSSTTRDAELIDMGRQFSVFHPDGVIFSKLDESMTYGSLYNFNRKLSLPLMYFTTGQRVPEDIELASPERLISLLLEI